jgi:hypothetical protein
VVRVDRVADRIVFVAPTTPREERDRDAQKFGHATTLRDLELSAETLSITSDVRTAAHDTRAQLSALNTALHSCVEEFARACAIAREPRSIGAHYDRAIMLE